MAHPLRKPWTSAQPHQHPLHPHLTYSLSEQRFLAVLALRVLQLRHPATKRATCSEYSEAQAGIRLSSTDNVYASRSILGELSKNLPPTARKQFKQRQRSKERDIVSNILERLAFYQTPIGASSAVSILSLQVYLLSCVLKSF